MSGKISRKLFCLAVVSAFAVTAIAAPVGPVVRAGSATFAATTLTVTSASVRTQISWQSFNVAANEVVRFVQPNSQSSVLNTLFDPQALNLSGSVSSNGSVLFLRDGMVSGAGMNLDLAGVISTSLRLPRMALAASGVAPTAQVRPLATLADGRIYVISQDEQAVATANGDVVLNPGKSIELAYASMLNLRVQLSAPRAEAINLSRLVLSKGDTGIFAGLFRVAAAARQAAEPAADAQLTAMAQEHQPATPDVERFYRYALLYARMRSEAPRDEGGMMKVALAPAPSAPEVVATPEPQPSPVVLERGSKHDNATLLALPPALAAAEAVAMPEPQPALLRQSPEPEDIRALGDSQLAAAPLPARPERARASGSESDGEKDRTTRRAAPTVIVLAQASAPPMLQGESSVKEVRIERRAPRYFTDHRGAMFFM